MSGFQDVVIGESALDMGKWAWSILDRHSTCMSGRDDQTYLAAPIAHVDTIDYECVVRFRLQTLLTAPCHVLDCQFGAIVVEQKIVIPRVDVDADVGGKEGWHDVVGRWLHQFLRKSVENGVVAGCKGLVGGVDSFANVGTVEVVDIGGCVGCVCAIVGNVVWAEAGSCAV